MKSTFKHTHTPMKSTFKLINLTRQGKVFGGRLQGREKQTSKGRAKKGFEKIKKEEGGEERKYLERRKKEGEDRTSGGEERKYLERQGEKEGTSSRCCSWRWTHRRSRTDGRQGEAQLLRVGVSQTKGAATRGRVPSFRVSLRSSGI